MSLNKDQETKLRNIINDNVPKSLRLNGKSHYISRKKIDKIRDEERKSGGLLPLAALLPLIFGGIGAAGGAAGGIAGIVKSVRIPQKMRDTIRKWKILLKKDRVKYR